MSMSCRLFQVLETELNRLVVFNYKIARRMNGEESPRTALRLWLRNDAPVALSNLHGAIVPCSTARFARTPFRVPTLRPGEEVEIARIQAEILALEGESLTPGQLAEVSFSSEVDLTGFRFADRAHPVSYAERAALWEQRRQPREGRTESLDARRPRPIPLSR
jgi:hypothetical protein